MQKISNTIVDLPGQDTLLGSWNALARISPGAWLQHSTSASAAVFPSWEPLNNAVLLTDRADLAVAAGELTSVYAAAGINTWALWVPSATTHLSTPDDPTGSTDSRVTRQPWSCGHDYRAVYTGMTMCGAPRSRRQPSPATIRFRWPISGSRNSEPGLAGWVLVDEHLAVAGAWSFLNERDCGIYAVGTVPSRRRRGLARRLVEHVLADAYQRGARTASLQSTPMAQQLYRSLGFEPAGRYEEWVPSTQERLDPAAAG